MIGRDPCIMLTRQPHNDTHQFTKEAELNDQDHRPDQKEARNVARGFR